MAKSRETGGRQKTTGKEGGKRGWKKGEGGKGVSKHITEGKRGGEGRKGRRKGRRWEELRKETGIAQEGNGGERVTHRKKESTQKLEGSLYFTW